MEAEQPGLIGGRRGAEATGLQAIEEKVDAMVTGGRSGLGRGVGGTADQHTDVAHLGVQGITDKVADEATNL